MIRFAIEKDLVEIDDLRRANQEALGFIPFSKFQWHIEKRPETICVLLENERVVSYIYWTSGIPVSKIQHLVVSKDCRGKGYGGQLLNYAIEVMRVPNRLGVACRCRVNMPEAVKFWTSHGFKVIREGISSGKRDNLLRLYKELQPSGIPVEELVKEKFRGGGQRRGFRLIKSEGGNPNPLTKPEFEALLTKAAQPLPKPEQPPAQEKEQTSPSNGKALEIREPNKDEQECH